MSACYYHHEHYSSCEYCGWVIGSKYPYIGEINEKREREKTSEEKR